MKDKNICKFITYDTEDKLQISNFIYESNLEQIKSNVTIGVNRMFLLVKGECDFIFQGVKFPATVGTLIFGFPTESFSVYAEEPIEYMYISFSGRRGEELLRRFGINKSCRAFHGSEGIIPLWKSTLSRAAEENIDLAAESILLYTFSRFDAGSAEVNEIINRVVTVTEESFSDPTTSITEISRNLGYNAKYISHLFKKKMGVSYSEYIRDIRIKYAVSLFEHGIDSVKNVALLSGFKDPLYFSSVFKKTVGVAPKDYLTALNSAKL